MHLGRRKRTATAVAAAVIGGLLGGAAPGAVHASPVPPSADAPTAAAGPKAGPEATAGTATGTAAAADPSASTSPAGASGAGASGAGASAAGASAAAASPAGASPAATRAVADGSRRAASAPPPAVRPLPQSLAGRGPSVLLGDEVTLVTDEDTDPYALDALRALLTAAGVRTVHEGLPGAGPVIRAAGPRGEAAEEALTALAVPERTDLPRGGYRLATGRFQGRDTVALDGVGEDGLFHAVQTLRQLVGDGREVPGVVVRDWPGTAERGLVEGFYGSPWTGEQRLAQIDFLGRTKQNRYLYAPGDDPYRQAQWRDPYPAAQRAEFRALAERAAANHVTLGWAVAPAQSMCLASGKDVTALTRKLDAMWELGVRAFQLQFQDASYDEWHCDKDADAFGSGPEAAATAHARVTNAVSRWLAAAHPDAEPLTVLPTEYYQDGATDYRAKLAEALDSDVRVAWTGVGAVPRTITGGELAGAREALGHRPLVTMDNYPVNDYAQDRLFLGPSTGRDPAVAAGSAAFLAHAMEQPAASRVPLFTAADYAWNPKGYRPQESWRAAVDDLAGPDPAAREALWALAANDASSILDPKGESAYLKPLMAAFWSSRTTAGEAVREKDARKEPVREKAARELRAAFTAMREAPGRLAGTAGGTLDDETGPWLDQLSRYGLAGETAVDMLLAQARGDGAAAWQAQLRLEDLREALAASPVTVGAGVLDPFLTRAVTESAAWTGADRTPPGRADRAPDAYTVRLDRPRSVEALTVMAEPDGDPAGGNTGDARVEAYVPGEGWRSLGPLSASGWTQKTAPKGLRADALRVVWSGDGPAPEVRSLVPWFADGPRAGVGLSRSETDAEIGGAAQRVDVELTGLRAGEVRGPLTAKPPKGIAVRLPGQAVVERGARTTVPLEVSVGTAVPAGSYRVPVSFAGEERVLTVRAFPRTSGPDLARGATASSSGDETPDFPAASAVDGDATTRWSSPAEDGAWWQVELAEPARIGRVVLHWQDAYASRYRIQVSADGRVWRTAATVADGRGGRETVRMDAADTRFLRVQGEARATRYGYSLWSVETYAVAPVEPPPGKSTPGKGTPKNDAKDTPESRVPEENAPERDGAERDGAETPGTP
ncbi:beta-N-acetylglucosaminidase domain-containing protein [Streptomyces sp. NPDC020807]|uniref:beta-N-acetylglucosaminidase domain-containing protein n=1 Tax=Streptomyces sp. NPDC020807 TaxID=3155119 RepID=UPI0033CDAF30